MLRGFLEDSSQAAPTLLHASKSARTCKVNSPEAKQPACSQRSFSWAPPGAALTSGLLVSLPLLSCFLCFPIG